MTPSGEVLDCDATRHPELFSAARVGLGALGVVTAVTLQAVPAFALRAVEGPGTLTAALEGFDELMTSTDHVEFYWFPHTDVTLLKCNTRVPLEEGLAPLPRWRTVWDDEILANAAFAGVVAAGRRVPALVPPLARISARALGARTWTDHSHRVFVSRRRVRFLEMEYAIPRADAVGRAGRAPPRPRGQRLARRVPGRGPRRRRRRHPALHGRRAGTPPTSPPTFPRERIRGPGSPRWSRSPARSAAGRTGGSCTVSTPPSCSQRYPRFGEFVALRDRLDPAGVLTNAYLDRVLGPAGGRR